MELTPEERQRIYLEEKARLEAQQRLEVEQAAARPRGPGVAFGFTVFVCMVAVMAYIGIQTTGKNAAPKRAEAKQETRQVQMTPSLELLASSAYVNDGGNYIIVEGMVRNASSEAIDGVVAMGEIYTANDVFISSDRALIEYQPLMPGQSSPFSVMIRHNPLFSKYSVGFKLITGRALSCEDKRK